MKPSKIQTMISDRMVEIGLPYKPEFQEFIDKLRTGQFILMLRKCPCCGTKQIQLIPCKPNDE